MTSTSIEQAVAALKPGMTPRQAAKVYAEHGVPVFPCKNTDKSPLTDRGFYDASTDPEKIQSWWGRYPTAAVGVPTGQKTGVWVFDVDVPKRAGKPDGRASLAALEAQHGPLPPTLEQRTRNGGRQFVFRLPVGREVKCTVKDIGPGLDVRGEGGYVVVAPSYVVPDEYPREQFGADGKYVFVSNGTPVADASAWLIEKVAPLPKPKEQKPPTSGLLARDTAGGRTAYGRKALEEEAARVAHAVEGERNHTLNQAAFALGQLVTGGEIERSEAEAALLEAAAKCGLPDGEARKTFKSGFEDGAKEPRQAPEKAKTKGNDTVAAPPPIPIHALPGRIKWLLEHMTEAFGVEPEIALAAIISLASSCIGRSRGILIKRGWVEHANLYVALVARSGGGKSPVSKIVFKTLFRVEQELRGEYSEALTIYNDAHERWKLARKAAQKDNMPFTDPEPTKPVLRQYIVDDATVESLTDILAENPRGILWCRDELAGLLMDLDKYAGKDGSTKTRLMTAYDCGPWKTSRINASRVSFVPHACLSIFGTIQPGTLSRVFDKADGMSGFLARVSFIRAVQTAPALLSDSEFSDEAQNALEGITRKLLALELDGGKPIIIGVREDAKQAFRKWHDALACEAFLAGNDDEDSLLAKLRGQTLRLALVLHLLKAVTEGRDEREAVDFVTMDAAISLAGWLKEHQRQVWSIVKGEAEELLPFHQEVAKAILTLKAEIVGDKLPTARVAEVVKASPISVGKAFEKLGLMTTRTREARFVHVTQDHLLQMESKISVTPVTPVTDQVVTPVSGRDRCENHLSPSVTPLTPSEEAVTDVTDENSIRHTLQTSMVTTPVTDVTGVTDSSAPISKTKLSAPLGELLSRVERRSQAWDGPAVVDV